MNKYINNVHFKITFPITRELNQMFKILDSNLNYNINCINSPSIICSAGNDFHSIFFKYNYTKGICMGTSYSNYFSLLVLQKNKNPLL